MHRLVDPPTQKHEERHPEQCELDTQVDRTSFGEGLWNEGLSAREVADERLDEVGYSDGAVCGKGDYWE